MVLGHCAAVSRRSTSFPFALLLGLFTWAGCSAILDRDPSQLGGQPRSDTPSPDASTDGDGDAGDGDGNGDGDGDQPSACGACDDGVACTVDECLNDSCLSRPDDTACASEQRCHVLKGCIPVRCRDATDCNDGNPCNGTESCNPGGFGVDRRPRFR